MEITEIKIYMMEDRGNLLGYANVVLNDSIVLRGIKIMDSKKGRFIAMPSKRNKKQSKQQFMEFYHPINKEARTRLTNAILEAYKRAEKE